VTPIATGETAIHCHQLVKQFNGSRALNEFELEVMPGQVVSLLGPSGCGKTTALRTIAGFEQPDSGSVTIGGLVVVGDGKPVPPEQRKVGMVFQDYALFPHMTVSANVGYGLVGRDRTRRVAGVLEMVGLADRANSMPHELSGGEQQRVALARALAPEPTVILLDEPFSNLDAGLRDRMRRDVRSILKDAGATAVFVTHDQEEALAIADIVAVMRAGRVVQVGTPQQIYRNPVDPWTAGFLGESEFLRGIADVAMVETALGAFPQTTSMRGDVIVMIRPEWVHPTPSDDGQAEIVDQEFYGHDQVLMLEFPDGRRLRTRIGPSPLLKVGDRVDIGIDELVLFPGAAELPPS
jgi:iron(III) transport system ATP-binding protein